MQSRNNKHAGCLTRGMASVLVLMFLAAPQFASAQNTTLDALLDKASNQLDSYLYRISHVRCTEHVLQEKLSHGDHVDFAEKSTYDYFILFHSADDDLQLQESRSAVETAVKPKKNIPMLLTNGFSNLLLIFHPYYRNSFHFDLEAPDLIGGVSYQRVHFAYIPGMLTPAVLALRGRDYPLHLAGMAWINPDNGIVIRIETALADDMRDADLSSFSARVDYATVQLPGWSDQYRFPVLAKVDVETPRQHWHNEHRFTDYKRFVVGVKISMPDEEASQ